MTKKLTEHEINWLMSLLGSSHHFSGEARDMTRSLIEEVHAARASQDTAGVRAAAEALIASEFCRTGAGDPMVGAEAFDALRVALAGKVTP